MDAGITAVCAVGGLVVGDALEVVVERTGDRHPFDRPWWRCPSCDAPARGLGLVPLVRCFDRAGGCRQCHKPIAHAWRPLDLAIVTAVVFGALAWRFGAQPALAAYVVFAAGLIAISAVDLEHMRIPNRILYPTLLSTAVLLTVASAVDDRWGSLARGAIAGAAGFGAFFVVHLVVPKGMGFGDVRLAGLVGLGAGWLGLGHGFVAFATAFLLGAFIGLGVMIATGGGRKTKIPFGPFLAAGALVAVLWGGPVAAGLFHHHAS
ncbi:MAG TPA: A24 family peptidase [Acidimicrobiales bacterium]|nr:A24 family peptidase [Acidimicrobiales bacterium]